MIRDTARFSVNGRDVAVRYAEAPGDTSEPAVVCMPGLACGDDYYSFTLDALSQRMPGRRALSLCFPGEGWSPVPDSGPLTTHDLVDVTRAFLDERRIKQASLVAHSRSGAVAVHAALAFPECISQLVLVEPRLVVEECEWARQIADLGPEHTLHFRNQKAAELSRSGDLGRRRYSDSFAHTSPEALYAYSSTLLDCLRHDRLVEKLRSLPPSRTLVYGANNKSAMPYWKELSEAGVRMVELPGGHFPMLEDPVGFAHKISEIVASTP